MENKLGKRWNKQQKAVAIYPRFRTTRLLQRVTNRLFRNVGNYRYMLRNIPEERRYQENGGVK